MSAHHTIVIVGAGQAGGRAAGALRTLGCDSRIVMFGDEPHAPYERPPLSKEVLCSGQNPLKASLFEPDWYAQNHVELHLGETVKGIDPAASSITTAAVGSAHGTALRYDQLIIATGARARSLPGIPVDGQTVFTLRTADDAHRLRVVLRSGRRVLLVGGGYIGLELAASARRLGCDVTVWEAQPRLLPRGLDSTMATWLAERHRAEGVDIVCDVQLEGLTRSARGMVAVATDGRRVEADVVVVGVGAVANDDLARAAGIACSNGVLIDAACRTSAPNIFAIGDVATQHNEFFDRRLRLESWENAEHQGQAVAQTLMAQPASAITVPWFWTDQYQQNLQLLGLPALADRVVLRGDPESGSCITFGLAGDRVISAAMLNQPRARRPLKKLIESRVGVDAQRLADTNLPLDKLT